MSTSGKWTNFECACPIHYVQHDNKIGIFCNGTVTETDLKSATIWILDENLLKSGGISPVIYQKTLQGSNHGIVISVDNNHVLHSLTLPERVSKADFSVADSSHLL